MQPLARHVDERTLYLMMMTVPWHSGSHRHGSKRAVRIRGAVARLFWGCVWTGSVMQLLGFAGAWSSFFDLANLALPFAWASSIVGLAGLSTLAAWREHPRFLALCATIMVASAVPVAAGLIPSLDQPVLPADAQRIKIVSFNLLKGNPRIDDAIEWLAQTDADILVLSELPGGLHHIPPRIANAFPFRQSCTANGHCSTVLLSRLRPLAMHSLAQGDADNRKALSAVRGTFELNGLPFDVVAVHLSRGWDGDRQQRELAMVANAMTPERRNATLVAGDFNASPLMWRMRRFGRDTGLMPVTGISPTWSPATIAPHLPLLPFDQFWLGSDWQVRSLDTGPFLGSDHRAMTLDVALAKPATTRKPKH
jgi:endonuclease/exonuclease/phosphatase (EEP) superfamily protein YafD